MSEKVAEKKRQRRETWGRLKQHRSGRWGASFVNQVGEIITAPVTFETKTAARLWLTDQRIQMSVGKLPTNQKAVYAAAKEVKRLTLADFAERWRETRMDASGRPLKDRTRLEYERYIRTPLAPLANRPLAAITRDEVEAWLFAYKKQAQEKAGEGDSRRGHNQASKVYSHLKTLMADAVERGLRADNPCAIRGASRYVPDEEEKTPTRQEVQAMLDAASPHFKALLEIVAWGGLRRGEVLELRRKDVRFAYEGENQLFGLKGSPLYEIRIERQVVLFGDTAKVGTPKTRQSRRTIEMPERSTSIIEAHLAAMPADPETLLFPATVKGEVLNWQTYYTTRTFNDVWERLRKPSGYTGTFHSLRAFALTVFGETGATLAQIMRRGGHTQVSTAMRYQRDLGLDSDKVKLLG